MKPESIELGQTLSFETRHFNRAWYGRQLLMIAIGKLKMSEMQFKALERLAVLRGWKARGAKGKKRGEVNGKPKVTAELEQRLSSANHGRGPGDADEKESPVL